ncbi:MAG: transglycosylase domain-containing protein [Microbacterium sp.]
MPQKNRTVKGVLGGLLGLVGLSAVAGVLATAAVTPAIAIAGVSGSQALSIFENLPDSLTPGTPMEPTVFYGTGTDGKPFELAKFYDQNRVPVTFDQVSPLLYDAVLSSEDKNFYEHGGVNLGATVKAVVDNLRQTSSRGASTISQQFVKNVLIQQCEQDAKPGDGYQEQLTKCWSDATNAKGADGVERKLQEMRYAIQIEKDFSKNDILLGYLNVANFGGQTYGIEAAANYYFGTTAKKLTLDQAAILAGMVQNPNRFRIDKKDGTWTDSKGVVRNTEEDGYADTKLRRNYVLDRMLKDGKITQKQHDDAKALPIAPSIHPTSQGCRPAGAQAYFCQYVTSVIRNDPAFGDTSAKRNAVLKRGGLSVYTSLDMRVQQPGVDAMRKYAPASVPDATYVASGVTIEATTGRILAIVQNTNFNETPKATPGETGLVYAADEDHNGSGGFGPGSSYKLFTLLDWLEKGNSVNETLNGRVRSGGSYQITACGQHTSVPAKEAGGNYAKNQGYTGTPMRFTAASLNTGFYAMAEKLDLCEINKLAARLGVHEGDMDPVTDSNHLFESVLGSKSIAPIQMAGAYATVANQGKFCEPRVIDKVVNSAGEELPTPKASCTQVISPEVAATASYALQGVLSATGGQARVGDGVPLIGKTGTNESTGTAMATASTKTATFIFSGFDRDMTNEKDRSKRKRIERQYGPGGVLLSQIRFPISRAMQGAANAVYGGDRFPAPDRNLTRRVMKDLPNVVGKSIEEATNIIEEAGFSVQVGTPVDSTVATGLVAEQTPGSGSVPSGTTVTLMPSTGNPPPPPAVKVPNVTGAKFAQAKKTLEDVGLSVDDKGCDGGDEVAAQNPGANSEVPAGTKIMLVCGGGH